MGKRRKIVSFVLSFILIIGGVPFSDTTRIVLANDTVVNIGSSDDWNAFAENLNTGGYGNDTLAVNLTADISITKMAGNSTHPFKGIFDGGGHTLTVNLNDDGLSEDGIAPFRYVIGATIQNLKVSGIISTSKTKYAAGIVGYASGSEVVISRCISSVVINSTVKDEGNHGGLVGSAEFFAKINISDCLFNGKILTGSAEDDITKKCGGFIGSVKTIGYSPLNFNFYIENCLYAPGSTGENELEVESGFTFAYNTDLPDLFVYEDIIKNSYYTRTLGRPQGESVGSNSDTNTAEKLAKKLGSIWRADGDEVIPVLDDKSLLLTTISNVEKYYPEKGETIHPEPVVTAVDGSILTKDEHYTVNYSSDDDSSPGKYTLTINAIENKGYTGSQTVSYEVYSVKNKQITGLGTGAIENPTGFAPWVPGIGNGNYVYYGNYDGGEPVRYRVLDKAATEFGGNTMLLDCDSVLYKSGFDGRQKYDWNDSVINNELNGDAFLDKEGNFTPAEKEAIAFSTKSEKAEKDGNPDSAERVVLDHEVAPDNYITVSFKFSPLKEVKIFLLDAFEATRSSYGYSDSLDYDNNRYKGVDYWFRSPYAYNDSWLGIVFGSGIVSIDRMTKMLGVSPVFNVNLSSVIFSTPIPNKTGEYKLTLLDKKIGIDIPENTKAKRTGNTVTVPYIISGENSVSVNRISVLLLSEEYEPGKCVTNSNGGDIPEITYLPLETKIINNGSEGFGTFTLPDEYADKKSGYHVYLLAENVNPYYETDYASAPKEISNIPEHNFKFSSEGADITATCNSSECSLKDRKAVLTINAPQRKTYGDINSAEATFTGLSAFKDATSLPIDESSIRYAGRDGTAYDESSAAPTGAGKYTAKITVKGKTASVDYEIAKADSTIASVAANNHAFGGTAKPLVTVDEKTLSGGTMYYALGSDAATAPTDGWKTSIPTATAAGTYYVWYKVVGDANHNDSKASVVTVTVSEGEKKPDKPETKEQVISLNSIPVGSGKIEMKLVTEEGSNEDYAISDVKIPDEVAMALYNNLSEEEKKQVENGASFTISLEIKEKTNVSAEDKKKAEEAASNVITGGETGTGLFLDIALFTQLDGAEKKEAKPGEGKKVSFTVKVPASLMPAEEGTDRTYILVHILDDGSAVIAATSKNISFPVETDSFSSWYLTYADAKNENGGNDKPEENEKPAEKVITAADNLPMAYSEDTKGDFGFGYCHEIPFYGKVKPDLSLFGEIKVTTGGKTYKAAKIKVNKKKCLIQITGLEGADKDTIKAVKKATKGSNGLSFKVNPYYVKDSDKVTPKFKKDGSLKSVKVEIKGKDYKAKKGEFSYDPAAKLITFSGSLNGSYKYL